MPCGCIVPTAHSDLQLFVDTLVPSVMTDLVNTTDTGGSLYRSGGTGGTTDAYGFTTNYVEGTGCGYWEYRQFFDDLTTNNLIGIHLVDEFNNPPQYGHSYNNFFGLQRVGIHHNVTTDPSLYYGPLGDPNEVGYTVGFRFAIYYNNGTVWLWQNVQGTTDTDNFEPTSISTMFTGLATDRRWRVIAYVVPAIVEGAHTPLISESFSIDADICGAAIWTLPPLGWAASSDDVPHIAATVKVGTGNGSEWWYIPQLSDSGVELRTKTVKDPYVIGKITNGRIRGYRFDVGQEIDIAGMEDDTRLTGASNSLPIAETDHVAQCPMVRMNLKNASMHTMRISGDGRGQTTRDRVDQICYQVATQGVRR